MRPKGTRLVNFNMNERLHATLKDRSEHLGYTMSEILTLLVQRFLGGEIYVDPTPEAWKRIQEELSEAHT